MKTYIFNPNSIPTMSYNDMNKLIDNNELDETIEIPYPDFIDDLRDLGHTVKIKLDDDSIKDFQDLTDRELRDGHNFFRIWKAGGFNNFQIINYEKDF